MRNIIEELYYGNITPCDRDIVKGGTYSHLLHLVTRNEDDLMQTLTQAINLKTFMQHVKRYTNLDHLDAEVLRTFIKRIVIMDTMPGKKGKGIEVKLEYTIDGEYKTYPDQQDRKTA